MSNYTNNRSGSLCLTLLCTSVFIITLLGIIAQNTRLFCFFVSNQITLQKQFYLADALMSHGISYVQEHGDKLYDSMFGKIENGAKNGTVLELDPWPPLAGAGLPESPDLHAYAGTIEIKINKKEKKEFFLTALLFNKQKCVQKITCRLKFHKNRELEVLDWLTGSEKSEKVAENI